MWGTAGTTRGMRVPRALTELVAIVVVMVMVATCSGTANQPSPSPTPDWSVRSVAELGAILVDPAAATDCESKSARSCDAYSTTAAEALRDKGDPAAVPVLVAAVTDPDVHQGAADVAWEALEKIANAEVIAFLVESITTWQPSQAIPGRAERADTAAGILGRIGGVEHNLVLAESTYAACQNNGFTDALVAINQADAAPLLKLLKSFKTIEVYGPLIRIGQPGTEKALLAAFKKNGYQDMAECFLNSGNPKLVEAAQQWAADRGAWTLGVEGGELWGSR